MEDYRADQFRRDWWNERVLRWSWLTRNDVAWVFVGIVIAILYLLFVPNMDWVFGLRS